jgi:putative ABC transport system ATP-binding protein
VEEQRLGDSDPILEARGLVRVFPIGDETIKAIGGVDLQVRRGEFLAIIGPSGAGKSTLLHLLGGIDRPTSGSVILEGTDLASLTDHDLTRFRRRATGFVFQYFNLLPTLNVYENVALPYIISRQKGEAEQERVDDLINLFGLRGRERRRSFHLSAGEQQRVAIARALLTEPSIVIADEPTGNLDFTTGIEILQLLWESSDNFRQTIVLATHNARVAAFADRVLVLRDGRFIGEQELGRREEHDDARPVVRYLEQLGL